VIKKLDGNALRLKDDGIEMNPLARKCPAGGFLNGKEKANCYLTSGRRVL
jgi:hypothetical protein